jgi:hypothetical protein
VGKHRLDGADPLAINDARPDFGFTFEAECLCHWRHVPRHPVDAVVEQWIENDLAGRINPYWF